MTLFDEIRAAVAPNDQRINLGFWAKRLDRLDEATWASLSPRVQVWANEAIEAMDRGDPIPQPQGMPTPAIWRRIRNPTDPYYGRPGVKGNFLLLDRITLLLPGNPHRKPSKSYDWYELYQPGMTVEEAIEAGIPRTHIRRDLREGVIAIMPPPGSAPFSGIGTKPGPVVPVLQDGFVRLAMVSGGDEAVTAAMKFLHGEDRTRVTADWLVSAVTNWNLYAFNVASVGLDLFIPAFVAEEMRGRWDANFMLTPIEGDVALYIPEGDNSSREDADFQQQRALFRTGCSAAAHVFGALRKAGWSADDAAKVMPSTVLRRLRVISGFPQLMRFLDGIDDLATAECSAYADAIEGLIRTAMPRAFVAWRGFHPKKGG